ncbi:dTDP-4-dehydrorhamnose 3,5-epimerase [Sphingomonas parva]|uniref:dTDP-4-dehydrorhamnose 3,5-epimerase n=1 Tax=Sphingomonas parva TaxID=2555898 RepID=A0A4Y8ZV62_9SPHN|nr:dTDP-4-dehydrorhamnose 3,5-epimerase [Sphingomonas parva]TFI59900.1 dTDP-4-dehydrorhamnose 3,5-epimerase [Sphingomonas parva]
MIMRPLELPDVVEILPVRRSDERGFFSEVWRADALESEGISIDWVQDNHSFSATAGVIRGLHFQTPPCAQDKLVRVTRGSIFDVAVDIRQGSPTFGRWVGLVISAEKWNQILVPKGFAHGFMTLEPNCEVLYKVSAPYAPAHDRAIRYDDPAIGVEWPDVEADVLLSQKDASAPRLAYVETGFVYEREHD